jgi:predicted PurR-regulated permease PerM
VLKFEVSYRGLVLIGLALLTLWAMRELWPVILLLIVALIFFAALLPYVQWMVRRGVPRVAAVLVVLLVIVGVIAAMVAAVAPAVVDEFQHVREDLPDDARRLEDFASDVGFNTEQWDLPERAEKIDWTGLISGRAAVDVGQRVVFAVFSAFSVIVLTAYLLVETPRMHAFLYRFVQGKGVGDGRILGRGASGRQLRAGQFITSLIISLYTLAVLLILDVKNPVAFAVLAVRRHHPIIRAFIAIVPASFAAFQDSATKALIVLGALILYQQFEDRYLVPRIYGQTLNLPPLIVLVAVLVGGELLGVTGVLLALPAAAAGRVAFDLVMARREGERFTGEPGAEVMAPDEG